MSPETEAAIHQITSELMSAYAGVLTMNAADAYLGGQFRASRLLRIPFSFHLVNQEAMALINQYRHDLVWNGGSVIDGEFVPWLQDMSTAARDEVTVIIEEGMRNGTPFKQITSQLDDVFTMQEHRSQLVAYQETRRLFNQGAQDRFKDEGIEEFEWHHMDPQPNPRPEHQARDGKIFTWDTLPSLDEFNCHCWVSPVTGH